MRLSSKPPSSWPREEHLFRGPGGELLVFHTPSGLTALATGPAAAVLAERVEGGNRLARAALTRAERELGEQQCDELLRFLDGQSTPAPSRERNRKGFNLSLNAGMACNLRCTYCDPLGYREATRGQSMSEETARRALDSFFAQVPEGEVGCVTYSVGGEPLLYRNLLGFLAEAPTGPRGAEPGRVQPLAERGTTRWRPVLCRGRDARAGRDRRLP